jgi:Mg2+-importing ATPase
MHFFRHLFDVFLKSRRTGHLFRSRILFESLPTEEAARAIPDTLASQLTRDAQDDLNAVFARLHSNKDGLSTVEADAIRKMVGPNEVNHEKPMSWWLHLWLSYKNPFNLLLSLLALVSWLTHDTKAAVVIGSMVTLSTAMRFIQERRSNQAALGLKEMVSNNASVMRAWRHRVVVGRGHDPCRLPGPVSARPVRQPVGHDGRIAAGGKVSRDPDQE